MSDFKSRAKLHDEAAIPLVVDAFRQYGYEECSFGAESDAGDMHQWLIQLSDPTSILLRFRPDRYFVNPSIRSVICEVKCEGNGSHNFAIEEQSYTAALQWNRGIDHVMIAAVDLTAKNILCSWIQNIPQPTKFFVPQRFDWELQRDRLHREWPDVGQEYREHKSGSGTPYFLVPKGHECWVPIAIFLKQELSKKTVNLPDQSLLPVCIETQPDIIHPEITTRFEMSLSSEACTQISGKLDRILEWIADEPNRESRRVAELQAMGRLISSSMNGKKR